MIEKAKVESGTAAERLYNAFRKEIEEICTPEILKCVVTEGVMADEKIVGIFCYVKQEAWYYIDALYILPNYRRQGLGKQTALNWYEKFKDSEVRLHIVNKNYVAMDFWHSIFELEVIEGNFLDTLYRVKGVR